MVAATALGLKLRPEGILVDPRGAGLACYWKQTDGSDLSRERVILTIFAGFIAQNRFDSDSVWSCDTDWKEANDLLAEMSIENIAVTRDKLLARSKELVKQHWPAIKALATALLAKDWVPQVPLGSGARWSHETSTTERRMGCEEVITLLRRHGIPAGCDQNPVKPGLSSFI